MELRSFMLCDNIQQNKNGTLNLLGVFRELEFETLPINFSFKVFLEMSGIDVKIYKELLVEVYDPEGEMIYGGKIQLERPEEEFDPSSMVERAEYTLGLNIERLEFSLSGIYEIDITLTDRIPESADDKTQSQKIGGTRFQVQVVE